MLLRDGRTEGVEVILGELVHRGLPFRLGGHRVENVVQLGVCFHRRLREQLLLLGRLRLHHLLLLHLLRGHLLASSQHLHHVLEFHLGLLHLLHHVRLLLRIAGQGHLRELL